MAKRVVGYFYRGKRYDCRQDIMIEYNLTTRQLLKLMLSNLYTITEDIKE